MTIKTVNFRNKVGFSRLNIEKLLELERQTGIRYITQVGVLGDKSARLNISKMDVGKKKKQVVASDSSNTNADIGVIMEYGSVSRGIEPRSFLIMPLFLQLDKNLSKVKSFLMRGIEAGDIKSAYRDLGILAENIIQKAFATRGFGRWAANQPSTIARKGSDMPLIDTAQLRKSISSRVVKR